MLLETGENVLVECAVNDLICRIGLSMRDDFSHSSKWRGQNLLGYALMMVRDELKKE